MSGQKIFIAVLLLIGILFIVGLYRGVTPHLDDRSFQRTRDWVNNLGTAVVSQQPLKIADLSPTPVSCLQHGSVVVPVGTTCTFAIQQSSFALRVVMLQLVQGTSAMLTLKQEGVLPVPQSLAGAGATTKANQMKVYPGKAQGVLDIECIGEVGAPACLLELMK